MSVATQITKTTEENKVLTQYAGTAAETKQHVAVIQDVMKSVMKPDTHFGTIPGTDKPTLLKPGAEVLCATFRIAPTYDVEDLSTEDMIRYRVICRGTHQNTGILLGDGVGECSTMEEKYKWRRANDREWEHAAETRRRVKYGYNAQQRQEFEVKQVRTEPYDLANTVLKMAAKRAQVAMTLNVLAASDMFAQDLEDGVHDTGIPGENRRQQPQQNNSSGFATEKQLGLIKAKCERGKVELSALCEHFGIRAIGELPFAKVNDALKFIEENASE